MSKSARLPSAGKPDLGRVDETPSLKLLQDQLDRIISGLDQAKQPLAAAYAQMALDVLRR